jgi:putative Ca2+/H+ antiporter (TMEM165/GDT1 family)
MMLADIPVVLLGRAFAGRRLPTKLIRNVAMSIFAALALLILFNVDIGSRLGGVNAMHSLFKQPQGSG